MSKVIRLFLIILVLTGCRQNQPPLVALASIPVPVSNPTAIQTVIARISDDYSGMLSSNPVFGNNIIVDTNSVTEVDDSLLSYYLPQVSFYTVTTFVGAHFEYYNGRIPVAAAYNKATGKVKLLMPADYCCNDTSFISVFNSISVTDKQAFACSVAKLYFYTIPVNMVMCDSALVGPQYLVAGSRQGNGTDTASVKVRYSDYCEYLTIGKGDKNLKRKARENTTSFDLVFDDNNKLKSVIRE